MPYDGEYSYSVGIGSDYDGIDSVPVGLEDVSKYPALVRKALFPSPLIFLAD